MVKRILVFPCGSEIGLEIYRSMCYSCHFELIGGSSVDDHGRFVYEEYLGDLPFHDDPDFFNKIRDVVKKYNIDAIYPTMDAVAETLKKLEDEINCKVIGSDPIATAICASKAATYKGLLHYIPTPYLYSSLDEVDQYPIFIKPDRGYGSRNTLLANSYEEANSFLEKNRNEKMLLFEYLSGRELTIDCFSDRKGVLRFSSARGRNRISNGISVNTSPSNDFNDNVLVWANTINSILKPRGAWFYQVKLDATGFPRILEVAARLGGSSGLFRCKGINFALLSAFDAFDQDVYIQPNNYQIELDRALESRYKVDIKYAHVFVDLDDCLLIKERINYQLIGFLYKAISEGKKITLLTRHHRNLDQTLKEYKIMEIFDRIIHLSGNEKKSDYIDNSESIFIDDSFSERRDVLDHAGIPVFSLDMIEALL